MSYNELPADALSLLEEMCQIGAPTGQELNRALFIQQWMENVRPGAAVADEDDNVLVDLSAGQKYVWLLDAHTDTVFPDDHLHVRKQGTIWRCPGIYDNTVSCVLLMLLARQFLSSGQAPPVLISFTSGEEGAGNLRGMQGLMKRNAQKIQGAFAFDLHQSSVTVAAIGSERLLCRWAGAGGHSWKDFGQLSAIAIMAKWLASLETMLDWENGKLSYNLGEIRGGNGINIIATDAEVSLEVRSSDTALLIEAVHKIKQAGREHGTVNFDLIGRRPCGIVPQDWLGLKVLRDVHRELELGWTEQANSTNANAILAAGVPATCSGLAIGGDVHTRNEWLETRSLEKGWAKLQLLTARLSLHALGEKSCVSRSESPIV